MRGTKIASRYAQSLLDLAQERNETETVAKDMEAMAKVTSENRELTVFLASPIINPAKKVDVLNKIFADFSELSQSFVALITKNTREAYLPLIALEYLAKYKASIGIIPVSLTSAMKLDDEVKAEIIAKIEAQVDGKLEVTERIDEDLIGGFVLRMGDTQIEASVSRQLKDLKQRLTR